jgi:hypothetical protein
MPGVPASYIKTAPVDWKLEFLSSAGGSLRMGRAVLPAASFGVWALLELIDCDFLHPQKEPTAGGAIVAAFIAANGKATIPLVQASLDAGLEGVALDLDNLNADDKLGCAAVKWAEENNLQPDDFIVLRDWLNVAFAGFGMIPSGSGGSEFIFGLDSFGAIVAAVGADMGAGYEDMLWNVPLCLIGHAVAQKSKQNGAKGVARPKDPIHMREQLDEAQRRHDAGLLYEWQEKEPLRYDLDGHENEDEAYRYAVLQHEARTKGAA